MRQLSGRVRSYSLYFNPRTREGCDAVASAASKAVVPFQPTHPRGVRLRVRLLRAGRFHFNPRTREGCDDCFSEQHFWIRLFQPTHPRGVRLRSVARCLTRTDQFQPTHPRGVRHMVSIGVPRSINFNPRTREGCDTDTGRLMHHHSNFNPRTREGCDPVIRNLQRRL